MLHSMTLEPIPLPEPIPGWNGLHQWLFLTMESLWNRLQKYWNRNISSWDMSKNQIGNYLRAIESQPSAANLYRGANKRRTRH